MEQKERQEKGKREGGKKDGGGGGRTEEAEATLLTVLENVEYVTIFSGSLFDIWSVTFKPNQRKKKINPRNEQSMSLK